MPISSACGPEPTPLVEIQPAGYADGGISLSGFPAMTRTNRADAIAMITPSTYATFNFYEWRIGLSGLNYTDGNNNRRLDPGEPGPYASVSAVLSSTDAGGIYSTTTVGYYDGYYEFTDVPSGTYQITVGQSPDLLDNDDQPGTVDGAPSGVAGPLGGGTSSPGSSTLTGPPPRTTTLAICKPQPCTAASIST